MSDIQLTIGKDLPGNMPLGYKNIISTMNMCYQRKLITRAVLDEFEEHCEIFFSNYSNDVLYINDDLFELFKEETGFNDLARKLFPMTSNTNKKMKTKNDQNTDIIIDTNKVKTNLLFYFTKRKKHKDGIRIIEDMSFDFNITIHDFIKQIYAIYSAEPYINNKIFIYDANYMIIAEVDEQGLINYSIDSSKHLNVFINNLKLNKNKTNTKYAIDTAKKIWEEVVEGDILDIIQIEAFQFTIISREVFDLEMIERERIDKYLKS